MAKTSSYKVCWEERRGNGYVTRMKHIRASSVAEAKAKAKMSCSPARRAEMGYIDAYREY